jgi:hypothetical protein
MKMKFNFRRRLLHEEENNAMDGQNFPSQPRSFQKKRPKMRDFIEDLTEEDNFSNMAQPLLNGGTNELR